MIKNNRSGLLNDLGRDSIKIYGTQHIIIHKTIHEKPISRLFIYLSITYLYHFNGWQQWLVIFLTLWNTLINILHFESLKFNHKIGHDDKIPVSSTCWLSAFSCAKTTEPKVYIYTNRSQSTHGIDKFVFLLLWNSWLREVNSVQIRLSSLLPGCFSLVSPGDIKKIGENATSIGVARANPSSFPQRIPSITGQDVSHPTRYISIINWLIHILIVTWDRLSRSCLLIYVAHHAFVAAARIFWANHIENNASGAWDKY